MHPLLIALVLLFMLGGYIFLLGWLARVLLIPEAPQRDGLVLTESHGTE